MKTSTDTGRLDVLTALIAATTIGACVFAYFPGLHGPFLFDDYGTLARLGDLGGVSDWNTLKAFVFGGDSGPTGRPLSLLSFLLDGSQWPTDAWPFKRTNLIIHVLVGVVLGATTANLLQLTAISKESARRVAAFTAAVWLLHPFLVSTTLYAVQRMAQLSTLFILAGLLCYICGRRRVRQQPLFAHTTMTIGVAVFGLLAILSKENGALLPLLIVVVEFTFFAERRSTGERPNAIWFTAFAVVPSIVIVGYVLSFAFSERWLVQNPIRGVSIYERVLTETRILFDYLRHWFLPSPSTSGIFQDHHTPSRGLLSPTTTLLALVLHALIIVAAIRARRRWPPIAFAVLFFYASHLLESTFINLELYFEHRNYLAAAFLFLPVFLVLETTTPRWVSTTVAVAALALLTAFTHHSARTWASYESLVESAAHSAPLSARAQQQYSQILFNDGDLEGSLAVVDSAIERRPNDESLLLHQAVVSCHANIENRSIGTRLVATLREKLFDVRLYNYYQMLVQLAATDGCSFITVEEIGDVLGEMQSSGLNSDPSFVGYNQLAFLRGAIAAQLGADHTAAALFRQALASRPSAGRAMLMASVMASNEHYYYATVFSDIALAWVRAPRGSNSLAPDVSVSDIRTFREQVRSAARATRPTSP
ncbi:MAG: hypothetical protein AAF417_04290 [Pseudomonadota bacterium]